MGFLGWTFANIFMPILLPVVGMLVLIPLLGRLPSPPAGLHVMTVVKDGQLCWAVIAMGTSTLYDLWEATKAVPKLVPQWGGLALILLIVMMLPAMVVAACGAVLATPLMPTQRPRSVAAWAGHYVVFVGSAVLTLATALLCGILHYQITRSSLV